MGRRHPGGVSLGGSITCKHSQLVLWAIEGAHSNRKVPVCTVVGEGGGCTAEASSRTKRERRSKPNVRHQPRPSGEDQKFSIPAVITLNVRVDEEPKTSSQPFLSSSHPANQLPTTSSDEVYSTPFSEDVDNCPTQFYTRVSLLCLRCRSCSLW